MNDDYLDEVADLRNEARAIKLASNRASHCLCASDMSGPCPGPENCLNVGCDEVDGE